MSKEEVKGYGKVLNEKTVGDNVKNAEYAIRGLIVQKADELSARMKKGEKLPFKKLLYCNIGNPLSLGQPTFSFDRQVLACALNPELLKSPSIPEDAKARAKKYIESVEYPHALGAYTSSPGLPIVRESIKKYIEERDGFPCDVNNLFLLNGASDGVTTIFNVLFSGPKDAVLIFYFYLLGYDPNPTISFVQRVDFSPKWTSSPILLRRKQGMGS